MFLQIFDFLICKYLLKIADSYSKQTERCESHFLKAP